MKYLLAALMMGASLAASAANHEIKMLNAGKDGTMVFEPGVLKAAPGDTVTFKAASAGHFVQSKAVPNGAKDFTSEEDENFTVKLDKEGVYVYICPPHRTMNMAGIIQVGKAVNRAEAEAAVAELEKRATVNQGRLKTYLQQIK
ncbi:plastocyanin/azurin family copper-binding protein [Neisseria sp. ZJ106]|uniref:Plastocyanin/azurin family copper-binding protein n=1 Tax=Neisseria lisongii TaxID=2912188 RepID=A0ABY7RL26_9NEIS|nr:plastocyanin/azurin family copper-binding protein [Neisseria lisongii]MCF7521709.1 plastocyanin/azurin family copper-binding protein [Neisseria lisongii]WCL72208.1 plastocyanin/azurin family copper-binding protein [Neisseria lisongii]